MKMIGKIDGLPVFEVERGKYIVVDVEEEKCYTMWSWFANLGKWSDTFEKCEDDEETLECLDVIEINKEKIAKDFENYDEKNKSQSRQEILNDQDEFYEWLEENREYNWFDGYTDEEEEEE